MKPTKLSDAPVAGDPVRVLGGAMQGVVLRVVDHGHGALPYAKVRWENGSVGRHSVTMLERVPALVVIDGAEPVEYDADLNPTRPGELT